MSLPAILQHRPLPKAFGALCALVVTGYAVWVVATQGVINPNRPQEWSQIEKVVERFQAGKQSTAALIDRAKKGKADEQTARADLIAERQVIEAMEEQIRLHRAIASGKERPPEGHSANLPQFMTKDASALPKECLVSIENVTPRTVLYASDEIVELLCSTGRGAEEVFDAYIARMVELKWLTRLTRFDVPAQRGYIIGTYERWTLYIITQKRDLFPGSPVIVYWRLESDDYPGLGTE